MAYVFYDTETTGTNTAFDQILQFAAILTDDALNEIERFETRCRLLPHVVPAPGALRATRLDLARLTDPSLPSHYDITCAIAEKLRSWSPAVFIGYNSLSFDEVLLRQTFFQNLKPIYLTNTNRNTRADILRLIQAANIYAPASIAVPVTEEGRLTRRLEAIAPANGFNRHNAHDALGDVEATLHMARLVRQRAPEIWTAMMQMASKTAVIHRAQSDQLLSLTEFYYGKPYSWLVVGCGQNPDYDAQLGLFDLKYDPADYLDLSIKSLVKVLNSRQKPIRCIRANNQPVLLPLALAPAALHDCSNGDAEIEGRADVIFHAKEFQIRVGQAIAKRYPPQEPSLYVEEQIYEQFCDKSDEFLMEQFHQAPWERRAELVGRMSDQRLRELGYRLIYIERPDALPMERQLELDLWRSNRLHPKSAVPWLTLADALGEAEKLHDEDPQSIKMLSAFIDWIRTMSLRTTRPEANHHHGPGPPQEKLLQPFAWINCRTVWRIEIAQLGRQSST